MYDGFVIKVQQIIYTTEEKIAGNRMLIFRCQIIYSTSRSNREVSGNKMLIFHCRSEINGELKPFEI